MTEREIAEVLQAVPRIPWCTRCDMAVVYEREARRWCQRCSNMSTIVHRPDYDAMARAVAERFMELGWVNLADPAVCHGGHAACVHVIEDMKVRNVARAEQREQIEALEDAITEIADFIPTDQRINIPALVNRAIAASMDRKRAQA